MDEKAPCDLFVYMVVAKGEKPSKAMPAGIIPAQAPPAEKLFMRSHINRQVCIQAESTERVKDG